MFAKSLLGLLILISLLLAACNVPSQAEPLPDSPVPASVGVLNLIAVGIAVAGGILGLSLALRRRNEHDESEADTARTETKRKNQR